MHANTLKRFIPFTHVRGLSQTEHFQTKACGAEQSSHGMNFRISLCDTHTNLYPKPRILFGLKNKLFNVPFALHLVGDRRHKRQHQKLGPRAIKLPIHRTSYLYY